MELTIRLNPKDKKDIEDAYRLLDAVSDVFDGEESSSPTIDLTGVNTDRQDPRRTGSGEPNRAQLSDREEVIYQAVQDRRGRSRRLIHERAADLDGETFTGADSDGPERSDLGSTLWDLEDRGFVHHDGNRWYPGQNPHD